MTERTCGNCRWWRQEHSVLTYGYCYRNAPTQGPLCWVRPQVEADATCGEWADKTITPEQKERRELVRQFAVAIVSAGLGEHFTDQEVWCMAKRLADADLK